MSHLPTLEEYNLSADVYSDFKSVLKTLKTQRDSLKSQEKRMGLQGGICSFILWVASMFFLNYLDKTGSLSSVIFLIIFYSSIGLAISSVSFFASVLSFGKFNKTKKGIKDIDRQIESLTKTTRTKAEPFENALYEYSKTLLDQHYETKLYKKHSGTPAFAEALSEFKSMIDTCSTANGFLLTKHFNLWEYNEYLNKRQSDQNWQESGISKLWKQKRMSKEFDSIDNLVKKVAQAPVEKKISPPEETYHTPRKVDWESVNRNRKITGDQGEGIAVAIEREYLKSVGRNDLADKIRHVSKEDGDGLGYDILSFFPDGREKFIEVKSTKQNIGTPFYLSRGEYSFIQENAQNIFIFRIFIDSQLKTAPQLKVYNSAEILEAEITPIQYIVKI